MATNSAVDEAQGFESCGTAADKNPALKTDLVKSSAQCGSNTVTLPSHTVSRTSVGDGVCAAPRMVQPGHINKSSSTLAMPRPQVSSSPVMVIPKVAAAGIVNAAGPPQVIKTPLTPVASLIPSATSGRTVVITVPRTATAPKPLVVASQKSHTTSQQFPTNIQIPPGMVLIRSDSGQLMLVSQQALAQAQQGPRGSISHAPRPGVPQVSATAPSKSKEPLTVIRMAAPPSFQPGSTQMNPVVKVIGVAPKAPRVQAAGALADQGNQPCPHTRIAENSRSKEPPPTFSPETMENVKKCKNFLVTLIKLASSGSQSTTMANNVKGLVRNLLEGKLEAEGFTEQLYRELKSTPQPCLVPFLKKSLPAVRRLTIDIQSFIRHASAPAHNFNTRPVAIKPCRPDIAHVHRPHMQVIQQPRGMAVRPPLMTSAQTHSHVCNISRPPPKHAVVNSGKVFTGYFAMKPPHTQDRLPPSKIVFKTSSGSYREDDDINDVASMAGVNLREENAQILTSTVGAVVQSCQDQTFLSPSPVLERILHTGEPMGVTNVGPEVVSLVSHATQECLRGLLQKLTVNAEHRKAALKDDDWHTQMSDVRSQLRFLEEVEGVKRRRKDEEERDILMRLARSRSNSDDPQHQQLKQKAKELQQMEETQLQQRDANLAALAAIGPRKKRPLDCTESQVSLLPRQGSQRATRVMLRDLLVCMEQDHFLRHSLILYKAML